MLIAMSIATPLILVYSFACLLCAFAPLRETQYPNDRTKRKNQPEDAVERNRQAILASPSYRLAELDVDFIGRAEQRPVRMQLELDKAETVLRENGIRSTVVVFGGTQIVPRDAPRRDWPTPKRRLKQNPDLPQARRDVQRAKSCLAKSHFYDEARQFARLVSEYCQTRRASAISS